MKPHVLVVDDFPDGREMLSEYLSFRGFDVSEARDGQEAIDRIAAAKPGIILMDLRMPGMDGWEATRRLKADPVTCPIVVIALTAHAMHSELMAALAAGCDAVVPKPYDIAWLADLLSRTSREGRSALNVPGVATPLTAGDPRDQ